jgi:hypothetical protein
VVDPDDPVMEHIRKFSKPTKKAIVPWVEEGMPTNLRDEIGLGSPVRVLDVASEGVRLFTATA